MSNSYLYQRIMHDDLARGFRSLLRNKPVFHPDVIAGGVDNRSIIQASIDQAYHLGGGIVKLPAGEFSVTSTGIASQGCIQIKDHVELEGAGQVETIIKVMDGSNQKISGVIRTPSGEITKQVAIRDLTIDGNRAHSTNDVDGFFCGVSPGSPLADEDIILERVTIRYCSHYGFDPHEITDRLTLRFCEAYGNGLDGFTIDYQTNGLFEYNYSHDNDRHGWNLVTSTNNCLFRHNRTENNGSSGFTVQRGSEDIAFPTNNIVENLISVGNQHGILLQMASHITIQRAFIQDSLRRAIRLYGASHCQIIDSTIASSSQQANGDYDDIQLLAYDDSVTSGNIYTSDHNQIFDNVIKSQAANKSRYGIRQESAGGSNNLTSNNRFTGQLSGGMILLQ